jgi:hypothetical protein
MPEFEAAFVAEANARRSEFNAQLDAIRERRDAELKAADGVIERGWEEWMEAALTDPWWGDIPAELGLDEMFARPYYSVKGTDDEALSAGLAADERAAARNRGEASVSAAAAVAPSTEPAWTGSGWEGTTESFALGESEFKEQE